MKVMRAGLPSGEAVYGVVDGSALQILSGSPFVELEFTERVVPLESVTPMAPVQPSKIVLAGRNYRKPDVPPATSGDPLILLKPPTAVIGPDEPIVYPSVSSCVKQEAELGVVVGSVCRDLSPDHALGAVFGYTIVDDLGAADLQERDGQWTRGKSYDSFCPVGPVVVTDLEPGDLLITCRVNGALRQRGRTSGMIHGVPQLLAFVSSVMTLLPGDLILTGTPPGAGEIHPGDVVEIEIEGIGVLSNPVVAG